MALRLALALVGFALPFALIAPLQAGPPAAPGERFDISGRALVLDAGRLLIERQEVRLWGIDPAGLHQPCQPRKQLTCGEYARIGLQQLVARKSVRCAIKEWPADVLHVIARCEIDGPGRKIDLSREMVRLGFAYAGEGSRDDEASGPYASSQPRSMTFRRPSAWRRMMDKLADHH